MTRHAALGFAPHSGWAALVAVGGDPKSPEVILRQRVEMADPARPGSKQPYHEAEELELKEAERRLARHSQGAKSRALQAIEAAVAELKRQGFGARGSAVLQSSGRKGASLEAILASHALIHTADGDHFREALAYGSERCGLEVTPVREREVLERAAAALRCAPAQLRQRVAALGRPLGPPWGADQKSAALAAWLVLAS